MTMKKAKCHGERGMAETAPLPSSLSKLVCQVVSLLPWTTGVQGHSRCDVPSEPPVQAQLPAGRAWPSLRTRGSGKSWARQQRALSHYPCKAPPWVSRCSQQSGAPLPRRRQKGKQQGNTHPCTHTHARVHTLSTVGRARKTKGRMQQ